jgi:hypothetical protein
VKSGPGLAKTRGAPLVSLRRGTLARGNDAAWRALFEEADTVSEGSARAEGDKRVWYGTTSLILVISPLPGKKSLDFLAAFAARDLHVRLRALRAACREAALRAPARLGSSVCEIEVVSDSRGLRIDVDVQAPLIEGGVARRRRPHGP